MKHLEVTIQQILIEELQEKGYSQKDIAKLLNVSRQTIFNKIARKGLIDIGAGYCCWEYLIFAGTSVIVRRAMGNMEWPKNSRYILIRIRMLLVLVCDKRLNFLHDGLSETKSSSSR